MNRAMIVSLHRMRFVERQSAPTAAVCNFRRVACGTYHVSHANMTEVPIAPNSRSLPSQGTGAMRHSRMAFKSFVILCWSHCGHVLHGQKCRVVPRMRRWGLCERPWGTKPRSAGFAEAALLFGQFNLEFVAWSNAAVSSHSALRSIAHTELCSSFSLYVR